MPDFTIEGYEFCDCCNEFVKFDNYNFDEDMCMSCYYNKLTEEE